MPTHTELEWAAWKESIDLCTLEEEPNPATDVPEDMRAVLAEFTDVLDGLPYGSPPPRTVDQPIELEPGHPPPHRAIYPLSGTELDKLRNQINDLLQKGFIDHLSHTMAHPSCLWRKRVVSSECALTIYRMLNIITIKKFPTTDWWDSGSIEWCQVFLQDRLGLWIPSDSY